MFKKTKYQTLRSSRKIIVGADNRIEWDKVIMILILVNIAVWMVILWGFNK